jgi:hypothetical protein
MARNQCNDPTILHIREISRQKKVNVSQEDALDDLASLQKEAQAKMHEHARAIRAKILKEGEEADKRLTRALKAFERAKTRGAFLRLAIAKIAKAAKEKAGDKFQRHLMASQAALKEAKRYASAMLAAEAARKRMQARNTAAETPKPGSDEASMMADIEAMLAGNAE